MFGSCTYVVALYPLDNPTGTSQHPTDGWQPPAARRNNRWFHVLACTVKQCHLEFHSQSVGNNGCLEFSSETRSNVSNVCSITFMSALHLERCQLWWQHLWRRCPRGIPDQHWIVAGWSANLCLWWYLASIVLMMLINCVHEWGRCRWPEILEVHCSLRVTQQDVNAVALLLSTNSSKVWYNSTLQERRHAAIYPETGSRFPNVSGVWWRVSSCILGL